MGGPGSNAQKFPQPRQFSLTAPRTHLDIPVFQVAGPTAEAEGLSPPKDEVSETDALDPSRDDEAAS